MDRKYLDTNPELAKFILSFANLTRRVDEVVENSLKIGGDHHEKIASLMEEMRECVSKVGDELLEHLGIERTPVEEGEEDKRSESESESESVQEAA